MTLPKPTAAQPAALLPLAPGLYIVATPIGNLGDITTRAADVLRQVALVAAEDTRVSAKLMRHIGATAPLTPYHDHNADAVRPRLIARMAAEAVALISDAGTPLISDPGYKLVRDARAAGIAVTTLPGPCAAIAALTLAALPTDRFLFAGFLPSKAMARAAAIDELAAVRATLVFYESGNRLGATLADLAARLGGTRAASVSREITKKFEETRPGSLADLAAHYADVTPKGEIVLVVGPPADAPAATAADLDTALAAAMAAQPLKSAVAEVADALALPRKQVYARALELRDSI